MQYTSVAPRVKLAQINIDKRFLGLVNKRQAWQFGLLPMGVEEGCVMIATTKKMLSRAHRFASRQIDLPFILVIAETEDFEAALGNTYQGKAMRIDHHIEAVRNHESQNEVHVLVKDSIKSHRHQLVG